jgi:hypothetical protein
MVGFCTRTTHQHNSPSIRKSLNNEVPALSIYLTEHSIFCETFLPCKLKYSLNGTYFHFIEDIHNKVSERPFVKRFSEIFQAWQERLQHCLGAQGNYEGDDLYTT